MKETFYKNVLFNSQVGYAYHEIILNDKGLPCDYKFIEVNPAFEKFTGLNAKDIEGKTILQVIPTIIEDEFDWISFYGDIALNDKKEEFKSFSSPLKRWYKIEVYSPQKNYFVTIFSDITKMKKQSENLTELKSIFSNVIKEAPIPIMIHSEDGEVLNISRAWSDITGYTIDDIPTIKEWTKHAYGTKQKDVAEFVNKLYSLNERQHDGDFLIRTKDNEQVLWDFYSTYIGNDPDGKALAMSVAIDVTEERKNKEALIKEKLLFETTLLSVGDGVISTNLNGEITLINAIAQELTGWSKEEAIGKKIEDVFSIINENTRERCDSIVEKVIKSGTIHELANHTVLCSKDGTERPIADSAAPIVLGNGEIIGAILVFRDYSEKYKAQIDKEKLLERLQQSQLFLQASLKSPTDIFVYSLDKDYKYLFFNDPHRIVMRNVYNTDIEVGKCMFDYIPNEDNIKRLKVNFDKALLDKVHTTTEEYGHSTVNYYETVYGPMKNSENKIIGVTAYSKDVSKRIKAFRKITESEERLNRSQSIARVGSWELDIKTKKIWGSEEAFRIYELPYDSEYINLSNIQSLTEKSDRKRMDEALESTIKTGEEYNVTFTLHTPNGVKHIKSKAELSYDSSGKPDKVLGVIRDITELKEYENKLIDISNHDSLTGLYNRRFFVNKYDEMNCFDNYPLGIMMIDVNGLKIINDAFGHDVGDIALKKVANVLEKSLRKQDIVSRIGGDEFAIILPNITVEEIDVLKESIKKSARKNSIHNLDLSLAIGYEINTKDFKRDLDELLKLAENMMYKHKLGESISVRNHAIKAILKTLTEKYQEERIHSAKVSQLCKQTGVALGLKVDQIKELELAGMYHDIGKISIPDKIIKKPGKLTDDEFATIKTHPKISYQILRAADEYSDLAIHALYHHERWDGKGYPSGKKGEEIPLFSRIICVADAYEAMTAVRNYKDKMSKEEAVNEIINCSGTQFDSHIAKIFVEQVLEMNWNN